MLEIAKKAVLVSDQRSTYLNLIYSSKQKMFEEDHNNNRKPVVKVF